ncbi:ABC transporter permease, partial [Nonomuraea sp. NPDC004297]
MSTTALSPATEPSARVLTLLRDALLPLLLVAEVIFFGLAAPDFLSASNLANVVINSADLALLAAGMTLVVLLAGVDVSVGPMLGVVAWVGATLFVSGLPPVLVVLASVLLGGLLGAINAGLIVGGRISPIIATLGTAAVFKTVLFVLWDSTDVFAGPVLPVLGPARAGGVPLVGLVVLVAFGIFAYVLRRRVFGR